MLVLIRFIKTYLIDRGFLLASCIIIRSYTTIFLIWFIILYIVINIW